MEERLKFIARLLDGEKMAGLCREFGISRKTGYKIIRRYNDSGVDALTDRSRRPYRHANQIPFQIEALVVRLKEEKPAWGAPKIRERLRRLYPDVHCPAISTVHAVLALQHGATLDELRHALTRDGSGRASGALGALLDLLSDPAPWPTIKLRSCGDRYDQAPNGTGGPG
jgi:hypothetical protein